MVSHGWKAAALAHLAKLCWDQNPFNRPVSVLAPACRSLRVHEYSRGHVDFPPNYDGARGLE